MLKCKVCGRRANAGDKSCVECGSKEIVRIIYRIEFHRPGVVYPFSVHKSCIIGRDQFRGYGEGYKYLASKQFEVIQSEDRWEIKGLPAPNKTQLNGIDITGKISELKDGDTIKVGNFEVIVKFIKEEILEGG